jgi:hypothetical protein
MDDSQKRKSRLELGHVLFIEPRRAYCRSREADNLRSKNSAVAR